MSLEEDILIERFLREELSETEKKEFEVRVTTDSSFKEKVAFEKQLFNTLDANSWSFVENNNLELVKEYKQLFASDASKKIKQAIKKAGNQFQQQKPKTPVKWLWFSGVASIILLFFVYTFNFTKKSSEELYDSYIQVSELPSVISRGDVAQKQLSLAQGYFETQDYVKSLAIFKTIEQPNATILIYKGISEIELHKFKEAETTFTTLVQSNFIDAEKGNWYLALLYLKSNQLTKAKESLEKIIKNQSFNYKKASVLIGEL